MFVTICKLRTFSMSFGHCDLAQKMIPHMPHLRFMKWNSLPNPTTMENCIRCIIHILTFNWRVDRFQLNWTNLLGPIQTVANSKLYDLHTNPSSPLSLSRVRVPSFSDEPSHAIWHGPVRSSIAVRFKHPIWKFACVRWAYHSQLEIIGPNTDNIFNIKIKERNENTKWYDWLRLLLLLPMLSQTHKQNHVASCGNGSGHGPVLCRKLKYSKFNSS